MASVLVKKYRDATAAARANAVTAAVDLWALGLIAAECATGAHLYPREATER
eukprot:COSAG01_NODE_30619_length_612_cov_3.222222_2_plen_51_part_01